MIGNALEARGAVGEKVATIDPIASPHESSTYALQLPVRSRKPRRCGLTSIIDNGVSVGQLQHLLADFHPYLDIAKFGTGTAFATPALHRKVALYRTHSVEPYFGGTLFEKFFHQGKIPAFRRLLRDFGIGMVEISNGTVDIPLAERLRLVREFSEEFTVLAEVGCKDTSRTMPPSRWIQEIQALLEAGARYVITEGRDSGTAGVYRASGELRTDLAEDICQRVDPQQLIFEAPTGKSQMFFINLVGAEVNLGNVKPEDLLLLETQRLGLRCETFFLDEARQEAGSCGC